MRKFLLATALFFSSQLIAEPVLVLDVVLEEHSGSIEIDLDAELAPNHVARIVELVSSGAYDNVAFHRVIDGFMAQTGDVEFGNVARSTDLSQAGRGGSDLPDLKAEFSATPFDRGVVGMARSGHPDSANSQFFIMLAPAYHLNGQYTVIGNVIAGMDIVDLMKKGDANENGVVYGRPDYIARASIFGGRHELTKIEGVELPPLNEDGCGARSVYEKIQAAPGSMALISQGKVENVFVINENEVTLPSLSGSEVNIVVDDFGQIVRVYCG